MPTVLPTQPAAPTANPASTQPVTPVPDPLHQPPMSKEAVEAYQQLQQAEADILKKLDELNSQETEMVNEIKELAEKTSTAEHEESQLQAELLKIQNARQELMDKPDQVASISESINQVLPEQTTQPAPVEPVAEPQPVKTPVEVIQTLHSMFAAGNAAVAEQLTDAAQVYVTPEKGILVENAGNSIFFTPEDVQTAQLTNDDLANLPQKTTSHMPPPAVNQSPTPAEVPTEPVATQPAATVAPETPAETQPVPPTTEQPAPSQPLNLEQAAELMAKVHQDNDSDPVAVQEPDAAPIDSTAPEAAVVNQTAPVETAPPSESAPVEAGPTIHSKLQQLANPDLAAKVQPNSEIYTSPDGNGIVIVNGDDVAHVSDAELIQANITGPDIMQLQPAPEGIAATTAEATQEAIANSGPSPLQPFPTMPQPQMPQQQPQPIPPAQPAQQQTAPMQAPQQPAAQPTTGMPQMPMQPGMTQPGGQQPSVLDPQPTNMNPQPPA